MSNYAIFYQPSPNAINLVMVHDPVPFLFQGETEEFARHLRRIFVDHIAIHSFSSRQRGHRLMLLLTLGEAGVIFA
jgi:hypothetical protein